MYSVFEKKGLAEGAVQVDISYDIIRHVSMQLYSNPRKAIEELVCNSYDAGASVCYVSVPKDATGSLKVLDNGKSMNLEGLKNLWRVALSPKDHGEDVPRIEYDRMLIGKFGIGKLAAFALGERLTHVACVNKEVRVVSVGQGDIKDKKGGGAPTFKVYKLDLEAAKPLLEPHLVGLPKPWEWSTDTWTLAIVDELDPRAVKRALLEGTLRRMITSALPVSAKFKVSLDGAEIPKREIPSENIKVTVEVTDPAFREKLVESLEEFWRDELGLGEDEPVPDKCLKLKVQKVRNPEDVAESVDALIVPELGPVIGKAIMAKNSLTTEKLSERGYSNNGFAITVMGKLINPEDELWGITARSHSYWSRFLAILEIPGLDKVLLVQRNAVSENSVEAQIARNVLKALFNYTRTREEEKEGQEGYKPDTFGMRLKVLAPITAPVALSGLAEDAPPELGLEGLDIDFTSLGETGPAAYYDRNERKIMINADHPLIDALDDVSGNNKQLRHVIGEVLAGTEMAKGFLKSQGVPKKVVETTGEIIETSVRSAAGFVVDEVAEHIKEIEETSYAGDKPFEKAIVSALKSLRLVAIHEGKPGDPDGVVEIPVTGEPRLLISMEAKGGKGVVDHERLHQSEVDRQMRARHCTKAFAVAREFQIKGIKGEDSALIQECKDKVPLITVEALKKMLLLHKKRPFTYDKVAKILTTWKHPDELLEFVEETWRELPELGLMRLVLTVAHDQLDKQESNLLDPGMILGDDRIVKWRVRLEDGKTRSVSRADVKSILETVSVTTGSVLIVNKEDYQFRLLAAVETILDSLVEKAEDREAGDTSKSGRKKPAGVA